MDETGTSLVGIVHDSKATQELLFSDQEGDSSDSREKNGLKDSTQALTNKDQELSPRGNSTNDTSDIEVPRGKPAKELTPPLPSPDVSAIIPEITDDLVTWVKDEAPSLHVLDISVNMDDPTVNKQPRESLNVEMLPLIHTLEHVHSQQIPDKTEKSVTGGTDASVENLPDPTQLASVCKQSSTPPVQSINNSGSSVDPSETDVSSSVHFLN